MIIVDWPRFQPEKQHFQKGCEFSFSSSTDRCWLVRDVCGHVFESRAHEPWCIICHVALQISDSCGCKVEMNNIVLFSLKRIAGGFLILRMQKPHWACTRYDCSHLLDVSTAPWASSDNIYIQMQFSAAHSSSAKPFLTRLCRHGKYACPVETEICLLSLLAYTESIMIPQIIIIDWNMKLKAPCPRRWAIQWQTENFSWLSPRLFVSIRSHIYQKNNWSAVLRILHQIASFFVLQICWNNPPLTFTFSLSFQPITNVLRRSQCGMRQSA